MKPLVLVVAVILAGSGCDQVFGLARSPPDASAPPDGPPQGCFPPPRGGPTEDSDGDWVLDDVDNCPAASNADQHDEDVDCRGDACDSCPHLAIDPDGLDEDRDGIGDGCDPSPGITGIVNRIVFQPFTTMPTTWHTTSGAWQQSMDAFEQTEPSTRMGLGFFDISEITALSSASIETVAHLSAATAAEPSRALQVGLVSMLTGDCAPNCGGWVIALARDSSSRVWLRVAQLTNDRMVTTVEQQLVAELLDDSAIRLEAVVDATAVTAFVTIHGHRIGPLITPGGGMGAIGLVSDDTSSRFDHVTIIY